MIDILSKPLNEIGTADIQALIDSEVPEGERVEFKKEPPGDGARPDPWMNGGKMGNYAKDRLLKEVVAFANAYGGVLVVGIDESDTKPAVAAKITPVPRCAELAESLKLVFRDRVDPQLARVEMVGIEIKGDGSGVVVIRVGKSRLAPHRVTRTLVCPVRQGDRSEEMGMRQIHEMTLNVSRGLRGLKEQFTERSQRFHEEFERIEEHEDAFGIRVTAIPVIDEIHLDHVFRQGRVAEELETPWCLIVDRVRGQKLDIPNEFPPSFWQPVLRGARAESSSSNPGYRPVYLDYREIYCDGMVEIGLVSAADGENLVLHPDWPVVMLANLANWGDHLRRQANAPTVEYALEVETYNVGNAGFVSRASGRVQRVHSAKLRNMRFPLYALNGAEEIMDLLVQFRRDFWHSMGMDVDDADFAFS